MKFFAVFSAILAVALGAHSHWTLNQLSDALENPSTDPTLKPILEQALNAYMASLFAGGAQEHISITTAPVDLHTWSLSELSAAIENPNTNPTIKPYLENALNTVMHAIVSGDVQPTQAVSITIPAMELSYWTLADVDQALMDPTTSPALIPYLEHALNQMMENLFNGVQGAGSIVLAIPIQSEATPATPEAVITPEVEGTPVQVVDGPVDPVKPPVGPAVVAPAPVDSAPVPPAVSASPLVQIIVNINQQESAAPEAVITPSPVSVPDTEAFPNPRPPVPEGVHPIDAFPNPRPPVPETVISPEPVIVAPAPEIAPEPVIVAPAPEITPEPVIVVPDFNPIDEVMISPPEVNPVDVIAVEPEPFNPIDVIAIAAPDVNPVDLLNPIIPQPVAGAIDHGPM